LHVSHRTLVPVAGLALGDYLLWNWSVNANHEVISLVAGLTLLPLIAAVVWLLALTIARLLARSAFRGRAAGQQNSSAAPQVQRRPTAKSEESPAPSAPAESPRKIAA
jgi:predicted lipid-binding transport protein (Tim44 family)